MSVHQHSEEQIREELRLLLDSDYWKHLSTSTQEKVLIILNEGQVGISSSGE